MKRTHTHIRHHTHRCVSWAMRRAQWIFMSKVNFCRNLSYQINPNGFSLNEFRFHQPQHILTVTHTHTQTHDIHFRLNFVLRGLKRNESNRQGMFKWPQQLFSIL